MGHSTNWCVYMHENPADGKKYIGITSQNPIRRWHKGAGYVECTRFFNAIQEYGWVAFRHDILATGLTRAAAEQLEAELIAKHQTTDPEKGYNLATGGRVNRGFKRSEETKAKIGAANAGKHPTPEARRKMSEAHRGKVMSPVTRERMSAAHKRFAVQAYDRAGREVYRFDGIMQAQRETNISGSSILQCCQGIRKSAGGYRWCYAAEAVGAP